MGDAVPQTPWDLSLSFSRMDVFALLQTAPAVQSRGLIGRQGNAGMRPERRFKPGMDGGLTAAVLVSPPLHLRPPEILSKQWGPPQTHAPAGFLIPAPVVRGNRRQIEDSVEAGLLRSAKGAARTAKRVRNCFAPCSVLARVPQ
jgi:hypothetical protein